MADDERDGSGQYAPQYPDEAFLRAVRAHEPGGTTEVAEAVGCTTQNADYRLRQLEAAGHVASKKVGGSLVWTRRHDVRGDETASRGASGGDAARDLSESSTEDTDRRRQAATTFFRRVSERVDAAVRAGYLFGSVARDDATESSDVDVLVVIDAAADVAAVDDRLLDIAYETGLEYDVRIEVHTIRDHAFEARRDRGEPFVRRVLREGEAIA